MLLTHTSLHTLKLEHFSEETRSMLRFWLVPTVRGIDVPAKTFRTPASTNRTATAFTRAMCATHAQDTAPEMEW